MAYRDDRTALQAQCETLRQQLAQAEQGSKELALLQQALQEKLLALEAAKADELACSSVGRRLRGRAVATGAMIGLGLCLTALGVISWLQRPPAKPSVRGDRASAWFAGIRRHCNPLEVNDAVLRKPAPTDARGQSYLAACLAIAGNDVRARAVIDRLPQAARGAAAAVVFNIAHPIADRGDDIAAGPVMELVVHYEPNNYMALFHAGIAAYQEHRYRRAKPLLRRFIALYERKDGWRHRAQTALKVIAADAQ